MRLVILYQNECYNLSKKFKFFEEFLSFVIRRYKKNLLLAGWYVPCEYLSQTFTKKYRAFLIKVITKSCFVVFFWKTEKSSQNVLPKSIIFKHQIQYMIVIVNRALKICKICFFVCRQISFWCFTFDTCGFILIFFGKTLSHRALPNNT